VSADDDVIVLGGGAPGGHRAVLIVTGLRDRVAPLANAESSTRACPAAAS
jgi:hypothetical protein